jgi:DEAD/DEAH box helicase domain-containing protein
MVGAGAQGCDAAATLDAIAASPRGLECVRHLTTIEARAARFDALKEPLHPGVEERLRAKGIGRLFTHQVAAIDRLLARESVVVATGTASGKSLCYQIPIAQAALSGEPATALMLFPTKALAQDQLRSLRSWLIPGMKAVTYDGDTADPDRAWARKHATVVLTNPEMLHVGILPSHQRWATFLMRLQLVVVDELHAFRGIFGSHVAHLLRRLRRVCAHYGSDPVFCFSSATIGNPGALASTLCGLDVVTIDDDGAPRSERRLALWERPLVDGTSGPRPSANLACAELLREFVGAGHQTLAFTRSRKGAELVAQYARRALTEGGRPELADRVAPYRAGYLPAERRALEQRLAQRQLLGVAATNALELGIDINGLDAVVLNGFPGTLASMWQQMGRAGRSGSPAAAVLVAGDDQLDEWYLRHPDELVDRPHEHVVVNPGNPFVARAQLACATHELPLTADDDTYFGEVLDEVVAALVRDDLAKPRGAKLYWAGPEPPAPRVGLRTGTNEEYRLIDLDRGEVVGTVDAARVHSVAHDGAIYLHLGRQYRVERLVERDRTALVSPADDLDEYTQARSDIDITISATDHHATVGAGVANLGSVEVTSQVTGYQRKRISNGRVIETVDLDLAPRTLPTRACWYTVPFDALVEAGLEPVQVLGTVHAAEHGLIGLLPLFTICDRWDVGGVSMAAHPQTGEPTIFIYDGYPGGAGIAELAFDARDRHVRATRDLVGACRCDDGCPSCVQSPKCGNWNEYLDKAGATALLSLLAEPKMRR